MSQKSYRVGRTCDLCGREYVNPEPETHGSPPGWAQYISHRPGDGVGKTTTLDFCDRCLKKKMRVRDLLEKVAMNNYPGA